MARNDQANDIFEQTSFLYGGNAAYIDELYARYQDNPSSVDQQWRDFFAQLQDDAEDVRGPGIDLDGLAHQWHQTCTFPTGMAGPACPSGDFTRVFASRISPRNNAVLNSAAISWAVRRPSGRSQR